MAALTEFDQLASLTMLIGERHRLLGVFREFLEPLQQGGLEAVVGESDLLGKLDAKLHEAFALLSAFQGQNSTTLIVQLTEVLNDVDWELAEELLPDLKGKFQHQSEILSAVDLDLRGWEVQVTELAQTIEGARFEGAPFSALESDLRAARSALNAIKTAQIIRDYKSLPTLRQTARTHVTQLATRVNQQKAQVDRVKNLAKQADLLVMQVGIAGGDFEYRVLLRSADRYNTRGINVIQDVRKVSKVDREWLTEKLDSLTSSMNAGIRAVHAAANPSSEVAPAAPATTRTISPASGSGASAAGQTADTLATLGQFLFRMVIPDQVQEYLKREPCSFSITTNDLQLPWELICYDADGTSDLRYLCLERSVSRMPLGQIFPVMPARRAPVGVPRKRRMLLIHSDPHGNLPAAADEVDTIARELANELEFVRVDPSQATNAHINDLLTGSASFDFLHYAGHANFDVSNPLMSGLQLKDTILNAEKIRRLNKGGSLVFLNACESGTVASKNQPQKVSYLLNNPEPVVGLASAFVYSGALGCVGSLWPVYDRPAAELAVQFYRHVLAGEPTGEALRRARENIRTMYPSEITWAGYVLYGDPTFRLTET